MRRVFLIFLSILSIPILLKAQSSIPYGNTIKINADDSQETIIAKAAHVVPTANQLKALKNEFIAFVHFGPNTFTRMEWGSGKEDPKIFELKELHTDQWCEAMKAAGIKMVILTVKHHDGFVLWQSRYTNHGIMATGFRGGKGDILKDLSASCKKFGLKLGIYLSPADLYQIENPAGLYGNLSKYTTRTIPRPVQGRPFTNKTKFQFKVDDYNEYFLNQLFEVLTEYGPIDEVWFDGAHPKTKGGQRYNYTAWKTLIKTLAPKAVIFGREDIRWCGNESGKTRNTEYNVIPYAENPDTTQHFPDMEADDIASRAKLYKANFLHYQQAETNTSIREGWFYRDDIYQKVRSADDVFDIFERSTGGNSTFLLNIPPNRDGKFSAEDVRTLQETGKRIRATYSTNLFKDAKGPEVLLSDNEASALPVPATDNAIIIVTKTPVTINRIILQEAIAKHGERVEEHRVEAWINNKWEEIAHATNIGYKRILRFPDTHSDKFRITILRSRLTPYLSKISAHYYKTPPPQLSFKREKDGTTSILAKQQDFGWKPHGENTSKNLYGEYSVYYTTDGTLPDKGAIKYSQPVYLAGGLIKAVAIRGDETGPVASMALSIPKSSWRVAEVSSETAQHPAYAAIDASESSYWECEEGDQQPFIVIDLAKVYNLTGFSYTPQMQKPKGLMDGGTISTSLDGSNWQTAETFTFGNMTNDPTKRTHHLNAPMSARFVKIRITSMTGGTKHANIGELDLFENASSK